MMSSAPRRLLFVQPRRPASLAPIHAAILSLALVGFVALLLTFWPNGKAERSADGTGPSKVAPAGGVFKGEMQIPPKPRKPGARTVWM